MPRLLAAQRIDNPGATGRRHTPEQAVRLDAASATIPPYPCYPYWNGPFAERNPPPVAVPAIAMEPPP